MHIAQRVAENHPESPKHPVTRLDAQFDRVTWAEDSAALAHAQEQERARISRELHDDIAQRIALLSAELGAIRHLLANATQDVQEHVARVASETASIGLDLQRIARGLHPAGLQRLGLGASIRRYCAQRARAHRITIDAELCEVPAALDREAALGLYRIAQEALNNVVTHSRASHAIVTLTTVRSELVLRIVDRGVGFDLQTIHAKETLGLISMRERARLVHARLQVSSTPGGGTSIEARLPLRRSSASASS
jgi:signal transduction histidine kinase